jgi:hypothetical protein
LKKNIYKKTKDFILTLLVVMLAISCVSKKYSFNEAVNEAVYPKIIFLNYSISKDTTGKKIIQFINNQIVDVKLKNSNNKPGVIGDLKCLQLDKDSTEITSITVQNPLSKHVEFMNDSLIFENKKIELNRSPLSIRLQLHSKTKFIEISEIVDSLQNSNMLILTPLDLK